MARHKESLSGGLVTTRDPALLEPGQLSQMRNATYRSDSQALQRAMGRLAFATVSATAVDVVGLRDIQFDNGDHYLIAHASGSYFSATVGETGTFTSLTTIPAGTQLEAVHYRNRFFLLNGASASASAEATNRVLYLSATATGTPMTARTHGMLPVIAAPTVTTAVGVFSQTVTGYYEYWTTEVARIQQDGVTLDLESTFVGAPTTVLVASTAQVPVIQMPAIVNGLTTHWRIYRSPKKEKESDKKFPSGFRISETATATSSQADTVTVTATNYVFSSTWNVGGQSFADASGTASALAADDGSYMALVSPGGIFPTRSQGAYGFNFGGFSGNVKGIEVELQAFASVSPCPVTVMIGRRVTDGGFDRFLSSPFSPPYRAAKSVVITATAAAGQTAVLGSSTDRWFASSLPVPDRDFDANFMVVVSHSTNATLSVDYVKVKAHYSATTDSVEVFPTIVYTFGDLTIQVGKNGPPPSSSTGDLFEDSLVVNDVTVPSQIRWSVPGDPEAFPAPYFIDFETRDNDIVQCIKVANNRLLVGLRNSIWRVNYLPSERDSSFDRGKAIEPISRTFGIVNPMCACTYSPDGGQERLAFVSLKGIHSTNGFDFHTIAEVDWRSIISVDVTSAAIALINNSEESELIFYYRNDTTDESYLALHLNYGADHPTGDDTLKASGPVHMRNYDIATTGRGDLKSAWPVPRDSGDTSVYLGYGGTSTAAGAGKVYIAKGSALPAEDPSFAFTTRRMYLAGEANEWRLDELYRYVSSSTGTQDLSFTVLNTKTGAAEATTSVSSKQLTNQVLDKVSPNQRCEGAKIRVAVTSGHSDLAMEYLIVEGKDFGMEDSGK